MTAVLAALKAVPVWLWIGLAALLAIGMQTYRVESVKAEYADYRAQVDGEKLIAEQAYRQEEQRRQNAVNEVAANAQKQKALDDAAAAQLAATGDSLRKQVSGLLADRAALGARLAARGKTVGDLADLLAKLRQQADDYSGSLAGQLDSSRRAGFACERAYDAIATKK